MKPQAQGFDFVVKIESIISFMANSSMSQYVFVRSLKELTFSPSWLNWRLEWWWQEGNFFVSSLKSENQLFVTTITPINKAHSAGFWRGKKEKIDLIGFKVETSYRVNGLDDENCYFEVGRNSEDFPILHLLFREVQSRWKKYQGRIAMRGEVNEKRANVKMEPLSLNKIDQ